MRLGFLAEGEVALRFLCSLPDVKRDIASFVADIYGHSGYTPTSVEQHVRRLRFLLGFVSCPVFHTAEREDWMDVVRLHKAKGLFSTKMGRSAVG